IVVTPGYVEMGKQQDAFQYALGQRMAQVADLVLLIGPKRTKPIMDGMQQSGFAMDHVHVFGTLQEANEYLASIKQADDVILYENDLPDQYTET
ncbi:MAG: UDP-N-acetylmuramoyl-tripeptide--D-alanyl-D-alanine ligase, partial [Clostridiales bacterium]|nr:UDP-N-acetylmuramoyl-tripeptide--D-alanyl-D-alanine ligase [Clostridiales bacterium]